MTKSTFSEMVETGLFGIAGVVAEFKEAFPKMVEKGRSTLEPKLGVAKFVGEFAVTRVEDEIQKRAGSTLDQISDLFSLIFSESRDIEAEESHYEPTDMSESRPEETAGAKSVDNGIDGKVIEAKDLPISGYRTLSAQQIIARLGSLSQAELDQVEGYERSHRNRTSVLRSVSARRNQN